MKSFTVHVLWDAYIRGTHSSESKTCCDWVLYSKRREQDLKDAAAISNNAYHLPSVVAITPSIDVVVAIVVLN